MPWESRACWQTRTRRLTRGTGFFCAELWRVQNPDWSGAPRRVFHADTAYFVTGLVRKDLWAVKAGGKGDITETGVLWRQKAGIGKYASPILVGDLLFTAAEESFLTCVDTKTGEVVWADQVGFTLEGMGGVMPGGRAGPELRRGGGWWRSACLWIRRPGWARPIRR